MRSWTIRFHAGQAVTSATTWDPIIIAASNFGRGRIGVSRISTTLAWQCWPSSNASPSRVGPRCFTTWVADHGSIDRSIDQWQTLLQTFSSSSPSFSPDRGRDGKLVAVDLFHLYGHTWGILRYESDSRCAVRVSEIDFSGEGERILTLDYTSFFFFLVKSVFLTGILNCSSL